MVDIATPVLAYLGKLKNSGLGQIGKFFWGVYGGTANQHRKFGKFRKFMGGTGSKLGWDRFPKIFLGGAILSHPRGTAEVCHSDFT